MFFFAAMSDLLLCWGVGEIMRLMPRFFDLGCRVSLAYERTVIKAWMEMERVCLRVELGCAIGAPLRFGAPPGDGWCMRVCAGPPTADLTRAPTRSSLWGYACHGAPVGSASPIAPLPCAYMPARGAC